MYLGHSPTNAGSFIFLDDIASGFNGSETQFALQVGGVNITPNTQNLLISLDGIIQQAPDAYTVSGSTITFTGAVPSGTDFYGILMGQSASIGQGTIGADELKISGNGTSGQLIKSDGDGTYSYLSTTDITSVGTLSGLTVTGNPIIQSDSGTLNFYNASGAQRAFLQLSSTGLIIDTDSFLEFKPNNTRALYIDSSLKSTFSGSIGVGGAPQSSTGVVDIISDTGVHRLWNGSTTFVGGMGTNQWSHGGASTDMTVYALQTLRLSSAGTVACTFDTSQNATFAGELRVNGGQASIYGAEGADAILELNSDEADDNADRWQAYVDSSDSNKFKIRKYSTGSWVDIFNIDTNGYVKHPNQPAFHAYGFSGHIFANSGDREPLKFVNTDLNQGSHYSTTTGRFTAPVDGVYHFYLNTMYRHVDGDFHTFLSVNGTQKTTSNNHQEYNASGFAGDGDLHTWVQTSTHLTIALSANDYVTGGFGSSNSSSTYVYGSSRYNSFGGHMVA